MDNLARALVIIIFSVAMACSVSWLKVLPKGDPLEPAAPPASSSEPKPVAAKSHQVGKEGIPEKGGTYPQEDSLEKHLSQAPERKISNNSP